MLDRMSDVSEGIDFNKTSESKECDICLYWDFSNEGSYFQSYVCNICHDLVMMPMNLSNIAILNIKGADYCCIISGTSKREVRKLMQNIDLARISRTL